MPYQILELANQAAKTEAELRRRAPKEKDRPTLAAKSRRDPRVPTVCKPCVAHDPFSDFCHS